ncbi:EpsG family protein [Sphingopyxis sp. XHP0097]|uniref:EpsG family protein n=1 Tax=Sphingopyxis jiangsuensis TaxID=2871171 RepID=A0ABS7MB94_9SPHN|nr:MULTISPECIES: EpsG family protein [Sphingopyxis]MBL0768208.1 EpsG family protein [Sphingopyxis lutea]MBY4636077.1 EpsG family protein [Sphingopyxis jiangsuensis]
MSGTRGILQDREVYIQKIIYKDNLLDYFYFDSYLDYFTSEYSWWFLMKLLEDDLLPVTYDTVFQIISTVFLATAALIVYRRGGLLPLIFLANPLIFELAYSQLRSGLAISILYLVYLFLRRSTYIAVALCLFAATIHTTMIIFLAIYVLCLMTDSEGGRLSRWPLGLRLALILGAGVVMGLVIGPLREVLLTLIGDRRAEYLDLSSSPLYLSFWVGLLGLFLIDYRDTFRSIEGRFSLFILSLVTVNVFTGGYSLRFLALGYPFVISTVLIAKPSVKMFAIPAMSIYTIAQWIYYFSTISG